jgi:hypothetical protein
MKKHGQNGFTYGKKQSIVQWWCAMWFKQEKVGYITGIMKDGTVRGCSSKKSGINANTKVIDHNLWIIRAANNLGIVELQSKHPRRKMQ